MADHAVPDLSALGLRCGIEIHQQLEGRKLFCACPAEMREDSPSFTIRRKLRAVAGEGGGIDIAAKQESERRRAFSYGGWPDSTCLVELDEMPPMPMSPSALRTVLQVAKMLEASVVDRIQIMRKTVVDGSNTSGFQRTALIAMAGQVVVGGKSIGIPTIVLEEDSARNIKEDRDGVTYALDRLGIPLIEMGTTPDIATPQEAKDVAETLGLLLRSTGGVKRGLGTIRQDVNVSIKGGTRVEIKGAQDLKSLPLLVQTEAYRQHHLLAIRNALRSRKVKSVDAEPRDLSGTLKLSGSKVIAGAIRSGGAVLGVRLQGFAGLLGREVQPGKRLGTELSDRAKVIAGVGGLFHSDELPKYGVTDHEVAAVRRALGCAEQDGFVLVADSKERCEKAMGAILARANETLTGVPAEVRRANPDCTTSYLRPMPGAERMYPETDLFPIVISKKELDGIPLPERIEQKAKRFEAMGLGKDLAELTARSERADLFEMFVGRYRSVKAAYLAEILMTAERTIRREKNIEISPAEEDFESLFGALDDGRIAKESVLAILSENRPVRDVLGKYQTMSDDELEKRVKAVVAANKGAPLGVLMGKAMAELRGKAPGEKVMALLKRLA